MPAQKYDVEDELYTHMDVRKDFDAIGIKSYSGMSSCVSICGFGLETECIICVISLRLILMSTFLFNRIQSDRWLWYSRSRSGHYELFNAETIDNRRGHYSLLFLLVLVFVFIFVFVLFTVQWLGWVPQRVYARRSRGPHCMDVLGQERPMIIALRWPLGQVLYVNQIWLFIMPHILVYK